MLSAYDESWVSGVLTEHIDFGVTQFRALPAGLKTYAQGFCNLGTETCWWSNTKFRNSILARRINKNHTGIGLHLAKKKNYALSIRCIKDN